MVIPILLRPEWFSGFKWIIAIEYRLGTNYFEKKLAHPTMNLGSLNIHKKMRIIKRIETLFS